MVQIRTLIIACLACFTAGAALVSLQRAHDPASGLAIAATITAQGAAQQQATGATRREPQFENEYVRSWKSIIMPNQPLSLHRHDHGRALIALTDGQLQVVDSAGKVINTYNWERGKAYWLGADPPGQMHADLNRTTRPIEVIVVELQKNQQF